MKNTPGPRAPPDKRRPRRKMTALSYSWNTSRKQSPKATTNIPEPPLPPWKVTKVEMQQSLAERRWSTDVQPHPALPHMLNILGLCDLVIKFRCYLLDLDSFLFKGTWVCTIFMSISIFYLSHFMMKMLMNLKLIKSAVWSPWKLPVNWTVQNAGGWHWRLYCTPKSSRLLRDYQAFPAHRGMARSSGVRFDTHQLKYTWISTKKHVLFVCLGSCKESHKGGFSALTFTILGIVSN
jgi:hypothetical protein